MTATAYRVQPKTNVVAREQELELSVQSCFKSFDTLRLSDLDVLVFIYRHGASLMSADQITRLIGYEDTIVDAALKRLEHEKLIERSRPSGGVCFYRILASKDAVRRRYLQQLLGVSERRVGRLALLKLLKPVRPESGREAQSARKVSAYV